MHFAIQELKSLLLAARACNPEALIYENVAALLRPRYAPWLAQIDAMLEHIFDDYADATYDQLCPCRDFLGCVPRDRVWIVVSREPPDTRFNAGTNNGRSKATPTVHSF